MTQNKKTYTLEQLSQIAFTIIGFAGSAKSDGMEAIYEAKNYNFIEAEKKLELANKELVDAEKQHFELIQAEADGQKINVPLILMHAEDQILSTQTILILAQEFIDLHKLIAEKK